MRTQTYKVDVQCPLPNCDGEGTATVVIEPPHGPTCDCGGYPGYKGVDDWTLSCPCYEHPAVDRDVYAKMVEQQARGAA